MLYGRRSTRYPELADEPLAIAVEAADSPDVAALVDELEVHLAERYPIESRHGFPVERLVSTGVVLHVARVGGRAAGCAGLLVVDGPEGRFGEVKRMYVRPAFRRRGIGRRLLGALETHARAAGLQTMRLETGIHQIESIRLYESVGFRRIAPFPPYVEDPLGACYELTLR